MSAVTQSSSPAEAAHGASKSQKRHSTIVKLLILVVILLVWQGLVRGFKIPEILVPAPTSIFEALWEGFSVEPSSPLALHEPTLMTAIKALTGLAIGSLFGLALAVTLSRFRIVELYAMTYIMSFQSMPKVAIAPLLIIWFGFGMSSTVILVVASTFFPVLVNGLEGFKSTDNDRIDLLRSMGATPSQIFRSVVFPSALPFIFSGLQIALVTCLLSTIVGEFVNGRDGLGARILTANNVLDIAQVFAVMLILGAMAALFDLILRMIRKKVLFWSPSERRVGV